MSILAIDYGARRIGIAVSESGVLATPHSVIRNEGDVVGALARLAADLDAEIIVLGFPRRQHADRREQMFRDLAERLRQKTCKEVVLWDESLSTAEAFDRVRQTGRSRRDAQREIDMHAAAVILQSYLDEVARQRRPS
jgi:putative Holliday junction resolvase